MSSQTREKSTMHAPTGSVTGLCSASATMFAVGMAFLGYWGVYEQGSWRAVDYLVMIVAVVGFAALGCVPWCRQGQAGRQSRVGLGGQLRAVHSRRRLLRRVPS
ncbi:hypothetical protein [Rhizobium mesosinicum]|uniref:hypothetical protein n=1 Tax=Rhizobium mesosinicum TaxID=335017 RepID=UPI003B848430